MENGRRGALKVLLGAGAATVCTSAVAPAFIALAVPQTGGSGKERWVRTLRADDLKEGVPRRVAIVSDIHDAYSAQKQVTLGAVWIVKDADGSLRCYNVTCPHLGCSVTSTDTGFYCPCHDSDFGPNGQVKTGPSPRGLDTLATRITDGFVEVDFRRYRVGLAQRVEIG